MLTDFRERQGGREGNINVREKQWLPRLHPDWDRTCNPSVYRTLKQGWPGPTNCFVYSLTLKATFKSLTGEIFCICDKGLSIALTAKRPQYSHASKISMDFEKNRWIKISNSKHKNAVHLTNVYFFCAQDNSTSHFIVSYADLQVYT